MDWQSITPDLRWQEQDEHMEFNLLMTDADYCPSYLLTSWQEMALHHQHEMEQKSGIMLPKHYGWMIDSYCMTINRALACIDNFLFDNSAQYQLMHQTLFCPTAKLIHQRSYRSLFSSSISGTSFLLGEGQASWYLVDLMTRRPVKQFPRGSVPLIEGSGQDVGVQQLKRFRIGCDDLLLGTFNDHFPASFVDANAHINHRAYFLQALRVLSSCGIDTFQINSFLAVFRQEILPEDEVTLQVYALSRTNHVIAEKMSRVFVILFLCNGHEKCRVQLADAAEVR